MLRSSSSTVLVLALVFALVFALACVPTQADRPPPAADEPAQPAPADPVSAPVDRRAFSLDVATSATLPIYRPRGELERAGVNAALGALGTMGEGATVQLILQAAPRLMNVSAAEGEKVRALLERRYDELDDDPLWADVPSPLPTAFEARTPPMLVAPPRSPDVDPQRADAVVFLHGYGGNGKLFAWLLSRGLPEAWVIAPSHGLSWAKPRLDYLDDALRTFEEHTGRAPERYRLVGLSDGGVGSFEVVAARPERFAALVNIVGVPRPRAVKNLPRDVPELWLSGKGDRFVGLKVVKRRFAQVKKRIRKARLELFDAGHYFLLEDDGRALKEVSDFLSSVP